MACPELREEDLTTFVDAVAGHDGVLTDTSGELVVKPCTYAESNFYEVSSSGHPNFATLLPTFMGTITLSTAEERAALQHDHSESVADVSSNQVSKVETLKDCKEGNALGPKLDTSRAVVLENVAAGFRKPSIIDIKLGARLWDDNASATKRAKLDGVAKDTTSGSLGFRIAGMRIWESAAGQEGGQYKVFDKLYGRTFTFTSVWRGLEQFFLGERDCAHQKLNREACLRLCISEVAHVQDILSSEENRMFSTSILIVMEGDEEALARKLAKFKEMQEAGEDVDGSDDQSEESEDPPKILAVKLIDFAHARWTPGQGPDENVLSGIRNLQSILQSVVTATQH
ncbi:MAG: hypothetical protein M1828_001543 [Chrysothrix sp. TS-e1954]|nr:MAG: hypothetical protein M1828_001543 [Chrysothrix sp. TS-e1954]